MNRKMLVSLAFVVLVAVAALFAVSGEHYPDSSDPGEKAVCPQDFVRISDYCFHVSPEPRTWRESASYCERQRKANIVTLTTEAKSQLVFSYLQLEYRSLHFNLPLSISKRHFWLGGFRERDASYDESQDRWWWYGGQDGNLTELEYYPEASRSYWSEDVPGLPMQDCLLMRADGMWGNYHCFSSLSTICETVPRKM